jgi:putative spermidine/putrescine transport system substrate-binding protein
VIAEYGRPEYARLIAERPQEIPLLPDQLVYAFARWDQEVGAAKTK